MELFLLSFAKKRLTFIYHLFLFQFMTSWMSKIFRILPDLKKGLFKSVLISLFYEIFRFIPIVMIKVIVDYLSAGKDNLTMLAYFIGGVLASFLILNVIDYFAKGRQFNWMIGYETSILKKAKQKLLELHLGYHESYNTGAQVSKITKGTHRLMELLWFTFEEFIPTIVQLTFTFVLLFYEQYILALIFLVFTPLILYITTQASKKVQPYRKLYHQKYDEAVGELGESLLNISTVKDYAQEKEQLKKFTNLLDEYRHNAVFRWNYSTSILKWRDFLISLGRVITLGVATFMVLKGHITIGTLVMVYSLTERAFVSTFRIGRLYNYLEDAMESINRLADLLQEESVVKDAHHALKVDHLRGEIDFNDVSFSYGKGGEVLRDVNLHLPARKVVAIVGRSGSGKTSLVKLLLRNYDVTSGGVFVDGKNIKTLRLNDYKRRIAVVSQSVEIFNRTVLENITFGTPGASRQQVLAAAKEAHAHEFILQFASGYDTLVGEKGVRLSGGQKQRISIARALLKNPDIFVFDEATSSLDSESEGYIQKSIFSIAKKKTTIIIAHRLSTIRSADLIIVMDNGKVVEQGTYSELVGKKGYFAKMVRLQGMLRE